MRRGLPALLGCLLAIGVVCSQPAETGYTPVAPAAPLHTALQSNLKQFGDWVDEKDFPSAAMTARGLLALAHLYGYQSTDPAWKKQIAALTETCNQLANAAGQKSAAECQKGMESCKRLLAELAKYPLNGAKAVEKSFKPPAATKTWMLLMDAAYSDAKTAKSPKELEHLAYAIAEEVNASAFLRNDANWRKQALAVREAALKVVKESDDLAVAKKSLKEIYNRCEACHQNSKR
jgi:hypothetical protein